ncbi:MAG: inorganic diphosphatase [Polyangiales bacterium]
MGSRELVTVEVEVPRFGFVKRRADGSVDFVSPIPCPFNYGSVPGTLAPDGDPIDAVVLGGRRPRGARVEARVIGEVAFVDAGDADPKRICAIGEVSPWERAQVVLFFRAYAHAKRWLNRLRGRSGRTAVDRIAFDDGGPR